MSTKDELLQWVDGVAAYHSADYETALACFEPIASMSKVAFNIGMIYSTLGDHLSADTMYSAALAADPYLAVGFLQKAYAFFFLEDYSRALLLENDVIDYTQLGLKYKVYRCEVYFNRAVCYQMLGDADRSMQDVVAAQRSTRTQDQVTIIGKAARSGLREVLLFTVPHDAIFEVPEAKQKNIDRRQFVKDAKVVVSTEAEQSFSGFSGALLVNPSLTNPDLSDTSDGPSKSTTLLRRPTHSRGGSEESSARSGGTTLSRRPSKKAKAPAVDDTTPQMPDISSLSLLSQAPRQPLSARSISNTKPSPALSYKSPDPDASFSMDMRPLGRSATQKATAPYEPQESIAAIAAIARANTIPGGLRQEQRYGPASTSSNTTLPRVTPPASPPPLPGLGRSNPTGGILSQTQQQQEYSSYTLSREPTASKNIPPLSPPTIPRTAPSSIPRAPTDKLAMIEADPDASILSRARSAVQRNNAANAADQSIISIGSTQNILGTQRYNSDDDHDHDSVKVRVHLFGGSTFTILAPIDIGISRFGEMVRAHQKLDSVPLFSYPDEEDPQTMISIVDDDDLQLALASWSGTSVHIYARKRT
eukprot:jgi/Hompol1/1772/HPOL_001940-RA